MKYIRTFENKLEYKYNIGDYVLLDQSGADWNVYPEAKIINMASNKYETDRSSREPDYYIATFEIDSGKFVEFWIDESEIDRKLSEEEINSFEARKEANKYNL